jgi:hypothetical protein
MWLRTELKGWLSDVLLDSRTMSRGYFKRSGVEDLLLIDSTQGGHSKELLSLAALELWHREFLDGERLRSDNEVMAVPAQAN